MKILTLNKNGFSNTHIIVCDNEFLVIDPSHKVSQVEDALNRYFDKNQKGNETSQFALKNSLKLRCKGVFVTHSHFDHIYYIEEWAKENYKIFLSNKAFLNMQDSKINASFLFEERYFKIKEELVDFVAEGDVLKVGNSEFFVLETTGHTDCSVSLFGNGTLFCGDLLFEGGAVGRTDLPTGSEFELEQSIEKIMALKKPIRVYSGHGEDFEIR